MPTSHVSHRQRGLVKAAGLIGGVYLAQRYVKDRLEELKSRLDTEKTAREVLQRRFQSTQEDVSYTVLALLPTLADQIMHGMDVESLTHELQNRSKARSASSASGPQQQHLRQQQRHRETGPSPHVNATTGSLDSSIVNLNLADVRSEAGSTASTAVLVDALSRAGESSGLSSWLLESSSAPRDGPSSSYHAQNLSESAVTAESSSSADVGNDNTRLSDSVISVASDSSTFSSRTKAELWAEVKMLTFTRTLTTLYSVTLLCLLTTTQLTILARSKYVASVVEQEHEERVREQLEEFESQFSLPNLLLERSAVMVRGLLAGYVQELPELNKFGLDVELGAVDLENKVAIEEVEEVVTEEMERKFLTMSWWILHVGWKDVGERVRRGVEEVFEGVSLKTRLAAIDLHRLVRDVRRRVEHEITFEGRERRVNFLSTLLPHTPEMIQHVLTQGGFLSDSDPSPSSPQPLPAPSSMLPHGGATQNDQASQETRETQMLGTQTQETPDTLSFSELSHEFDASPATGLSGLFNNPGNPHNVVPLGNPNLGERAKLNHHHHHHHRQQQRHGKGQEQDTDVCVDCASVSHLGPSSASASGSGPAPITPQALPKRAPLVPTSRPKQKQKSHHPHPRPRPTPTLEHVTDPPFYALIEETRAIICSADFEHVLEACLDGATGVLVEGLEKSVFAASGENAGATGGGENDGGRIRLASLLPGLAKWSRLALNGLPNELVDNVLVLREVQCLSAIVFAKFEEQFPAS